jgi:hypothetical protein
VASFIALEWLTSGTPSSFTFLSKASKAAWLTYGQLLLKESIFCNLVALLLEEEAIAMGWKFDCKNIW